MSPSVISNRVLYFSFRTFIVDVYGNKAAVLKHEQNVLNIRQ